MEIHSDIKAWQFELHQKVTDIGAAQAIWDRIKNQLSGIKAKVLRDLEKQYDALQMELSKNFVKAKSAIEDISLKIEKPLEKALQSLKLIKKFVIPARYPIPLVKHAWLILMKDYLAKLPTNIKQSHQTLLKNYQNKLKSSIHKLTSSK